jgi:F-box and leucine-rich repeat protein 2/20
VILILFLLCQSGSSIEAEVRDAICLGSGLCPVTLAVTSLCSRFPNLNKVEFNYSGWKPDHGMQLDNQGLHVLSSCCCLSIDDLGLGFLAGVKKLMSLRLNTLPAITSCGLLSVAVDCKSLISSLPYPLQKSKQCGMAGLPWQD